MNQFYALHLACGTSAMPQAGPFPHPDAVMEHFARASWDTRFTEGDIAVLVEITDTGELARWEVLDPYDIILRSITPDIRTPESYLFE